MTAATNTGTSTALTGRKQPIFDRDPDAPNTSAPSGRGEMSHAGDVPEMNRSRAIIEAVSPSVDGGRFAAKGSIGEPITVEADVIVDGHDKPAAAVLWRHAGETVWQEADMAPTVNDRWAGSFRATRVGWLEFTVVAWHDRFGTWQYDLRKRVNAGQDVGVDLLIGANLIAEAAESAVEGEVRRSLGGFAAMLRRPDQRTQATEVALGATLAELMRRHAPRPFATEWPRVERVWVDRERARFSSWYEFFPRSASNDLARHGTLKDVEAQLDRVARLGFDVLYLPPIHPIGRQFRKGKNNSTTANEGDVGSPWAIGGPEGGHDAVHPELGTVEDVRHLVAAAKEKGIDVALDLAFQCSPDHPYVKEHPEWFKHRPDGTIQYAENPPKKYQDIYPFDFECDAYEALWDELLRVTLFWVEQGVRIFRVDNPHTKPFNFWEFLIARVKEREPDVLFLSEAFTRPKVMYRLAKLGFTQSYTYFTWRNDPFTFKQYYEELTSRPVVDFFRPNAWPNTPDILPEYLQTNARSAYIVRAVLAATVNANWGVYGPAFESMDNRPPAPGKEEYADSEKYQLRTWDKLDTPESLSDLLGLLNRIRKSNVALQHDRGLKFHHSDNGQVVAFSKRHGDNAVLVCANTDPYNKQWSRLWLDLDAIGVSRDEPFQVHDLLTGARYRWQGQEQWVVLDPGSTPAHVFAIRRRVRSERDFEQFM